MGLFDTKKKPAPAPAPVIEPEVIAEPEPEVIAVPEEKVKTKIGEGITLTGDLNATEDIEINGSLIGNLDSDSNVNISQTGYYKGTANAKDVYLCGYFEGELKCSSLTMCSNGRFNGTLYTNKLVTDEGAELMGQITLIRKPQPKAEPAEFFSTGETMDSMLSELPEA